MPDTKPPATISVKIPYAVYSSIQKLQGYEHSIPDAVVRSALADWMAGQLAQHIVIEQSILLAFVSAIQQISDDYNEVNPVPAEVVNKAINDVLGDYAADIHENGSIVKTLERLFKIEWKGEASDEH